MKAKFLNNLQLKVTVVFLLVSLVPLGTVSIFSVQTANNVIESIVQNQLENVAAEKQALLERWIMERKADTEVLAGSSLDISAQITNPDGQPYEAKLFVAPEGEEETAVSMLSSVLND